MKEPYSFVLTPAAHERGGGLQRGAFALVFVVFACTGELHQGTLGEDAALDSAAPTRPDAAADAPSPPTADAGRDVGAELADAAPSDRGADEGSSNAVLALGYLERTLVSCDDGRTWRDEVAGATPGCEEVDCLHHPTSPQGLGFDGDAWYRGLGWGRGTGRVQRSTDGIDWETVLETERVFGAFGVDGDTLVVVGREQTLRSTDGGESWEGVPGVRENPRRLVRASSAGESVLIAHYSGAFSVTTVSYDQGATWTIPDHEDPDVYPQSCGGFFRGLGAIGDVVFYAGPETFCVSNDRGRSYLAYDSPFRIESNVLSVSGELWAYGAGALHRSTDGVDWRSTPVEGPERFSVRAVLRTPTGAFIGSNKGRNEDHRFYRSEDGLRWEQVGDHPGHAIQRLANGYSPLCAD